MIQSNRTEQFLRLYSGCESHLFAYLLTLLGNWNDAEEVFQETTLALWRSFDDFHAGTDFTRWAKRIAFNRVLTFRKQKQRHGIPHSNEFLNAVEEAFAQQSDVLDARTRALAQCVGKLGEQDRQLLALRYETSRKVKDVATQVGRPANTVYKALERIRHALIDCVDRTLAREEHA